MFSRFLVLATSVFRMQKLLTKEDPEKNLTKSMTKSVGWKARMLSQEDKTILI